MNKLAEIAACLPDWKIETAESDYHELSHQRETEAKIHLHYLTRENRINCELGYHYKSKYIFDFTSFSNREQWQGKKATASGKRPAERIAKEFNKKLLTAYLEAFKGWREVMENYFAREQEKADKCQYFAEFLGTKPRQLINNEIDFQYREPNDFLINGQCYYWRSNGYVTTNLKLEDLSIAQTEAILNLVKSWQKADLK